MCRHQRPTYVVGTVNHIMIFWERLIPLLRSIETLPRKQSAHPSSSQLALTTFTTTSPSSSHHLQHTHTMPHKISIETISQDRHTSARPSRVFGLLNGHGFGLFPTGTGRQVGVSSRALEEEGEGVFGMARRRRGLTGGGRGKVSAERQGGNECERSENLPSRRRHEAVVGRPRYRILVSVSKDQHG